MPETNTKTPQPLKGLPTQAPQPLKGLPTQAPQPR